MAHGSASVPVVSERQAGEDIAPPMPHEVPATLTIPFYALVAWGLSLVLVAFRILADRDSSGIVMRVVVVAWLGVPAALGSMKVLADFDAHPPLLVRIVAPMALFVVAVVLSPWGKRAVERLPTSLLVGGQAFRLPLELILYGLAAREVIPVEMSLAGYNFDVVTGLSALVLWYYIRRGTAPLWLIWLWNTVGLLTLLTIVILAILSLPEPFGWFQPPNRIVAYYPWVLLPTFLVQLAFMSHLLLFRKLLSPEVELLPPNVFADTAE